MRHPKRLEVTEAVSAALTRGHPWVYRDGLEKPAHSLEDGAVVDVYSRGEFLGRGLWDQTSPLAIRIYTREPNVQIDAPWLLQRIGAAADRRLAIFDESTDAYRLLNGEGDRVPGLVIDRYGSVGVVRTDGNAIRTWITRLSPGLVDALARHDIRSVVLRASREQNPKGSKIEHLAGATAPPSVVTKEYGLIQEVDLEHGQKTGAFLDQRDNRRRVRNLVRPGNRVLNLFSYTGGFSVAAALGGASEVVSVDIAAKAHRTASDSFRRNELTNVSHEMVTADVAQYLKRAASSGRRFDVVISDPPSYAPNEKSVRKAMQAYRTLHRAAASLVKPGGIFCAASCSSHVDLEAFMTTLDDRSIGRTDLQLESAFGNPPDHPSLAGFSEGRYLKFVVLRAT